MMMSVVMAGRVMMTRRVMIISVVMTRRGVTVAAFPFFAFAAFSVGFASQERISDFRPSTHFLHFDLRVEVIDRSSLSLSAKEQDAGRQGD